MHRPLCRAVGSMRGKADDSSYESCSEDGHSSVSRRTSGQTSLSRDEYTIDSLSSELGSSSLDDSLIRFALTLGYSKTEVDSAIQELGQSVDQDSLLSLLVSKGSVSTPRLSSSLTHPSPLRTVIIDGSNVALAHGRRQIFSCSSIRACVQFFKNRGHSDILVFLPAYRRETPRSHAPVSDHHLLEELDKEGLIVWTPSRRVDGRRIVCHDDRFILRTAVDKDAVIVSNDEFRDLVKEDPQFKFIVENRLLMYTMVDGKFMPPDDPLGKGGPSLDCFLSKSSLPSKAQWCPYAKKCTYGNKCKFVHPERMNTPLVSLPDRLKGTAANKLDGRGHETVARTSSLDPASIARRLDKKKDWTTESHTSLTRNRSVPIDSPMSPSLFAPSTNIWGTSSLSVGPVTASEERRSERERIAYHLSQVFPSSAVQNVLVSHPNENDPRRLCEAILQLERGFERGEGRVEGAS